MTSRNDSQDSPLSGGAVCLLALVAGGAIANNYAFQPSLSAIAQDVGVGHDKASLASSSVMLGYLLGLALLVPLTDYVRPRWLIPGQLLVLAIALCAASMPPSFAALLACLMLVGATTTVAAQASAMVGRLADATRRGRQMGLISGGISAGILLSRFAGGALSAWFGWRAMFLCFAATSLVAAVLTALRLPDHHPRPTSSYFATLRSAHGLLSQYPALRTSVATGMLWFFAFNAVWVGLSLRLSQPPYALGSNEIGLYGLAGLLGLLATPIAGRLADRQGAGRVRLAGLAFAALASLALFPALGHPAWTALALAVFDAGCFAAQVANQAGIVRMAPSSSGVLNSVYLLLYYVAGAVGTAAAGPLVSVGGWHLLMATAFTAIACSLLLAARCKGQARQKRKRYARPRNCSRVL